MVFGSNSVDPRGRGDKDEVLLFAQDASLSGQHAQQWELRMTAQEAATTEVATRKLRQRLAYTKFFNCTDARVGDSALS